MCISEAIFVTIDKKKILLEFFVCITEAIQTKSNDIHSSTFATTDKKHFFIFFNMHYHAFIQFE
jgi:hypothetical protein